MNRLILKRGKRFNLLSYAFYLVFLFIGIVECDGQSNTKSFDQCDLVFIGRARSSFDYGEGKVVEYRIYENLKSNYTTGGSALVYIASNEYQPVLDENYLVFAKMFNPQRLGLFQSSDSLIYLEQSLSKQRLNSLRKLCVGPIGHRDKTCDRAISWVCGCDGKEYANACLANLSGIQRWVRGKCK